MRTILHPCESCGRHFRVAEAACPFCGAHAPEAARVDEGSAARPVSRAALLFMGATAVAGCSSSPSTPTNPSDAAVVDTGGPVAAYGPGPVMDSGAGDTGGPVALYGPAPVDSGGPDSNPVAAYGPAPVDSGTG